MKQKRELKIMSKIKLKNNFNLYLIFICTLLILLILLKIQYYEYLPGLSLIFLSLPCFYIYISNLISFRDELVKKNEINEEIFKGTYLKAGLYLDSKFEDKIIETLRKKTRRGVLLLFLSIFYFLLLIGLSTY